jgi:hypothetical protein
VDTGLFHVKPTLKIFDLGTSSVIYQQTVFDFEIRQEAPSKVPIDTSVITAHFLGNSLGVTAEDLQDQRIVFISDSSVGSENISLTIKVQCSQEIRLRNEFSGEGQFDFLLVKLSEDYMLYPEVGVGKFLGPLNSRIEDRCERIQFQRSGVRRGVFESNYLPTRSGHSSQPTDSSDN